MKIRFNVICILFLPIFMVSSCAVKNAALQTNPEVLKLVDATLQTAKEQYKVLAKNTPADRLPRSFDKNGKLTTSDSQWWCSGFYPGTLLYLNEATNDPLIKAEALEKLKLLEKEQFNTTTHDLGFMMFCSFGNANRLDPKPEYKEILINSAKSLASRFNPKTGVIRSWNTKNPSDYLVIIDNMMNLELLLWASKASGDSSLYKIAVTHANTTMRDFFRPDLSSYHLVNYDPETGAPKIKKTVQGASDSSAWARGQAWGLYGFVVMYRETKDTKYLELAKNIANFILSHPNLPADKVPYWDFDAPGIPNAIRDASAGALIASALIELAQYDKAGAKRYLNVSETILRTLSTPEYLATRGDNGGFVLKHSVGSLPEKGEVDVPLTYADYYFVEAMMRYKALKNSNK